MDDATQKLVDGLRLDARDYGRKMRGEVPPEELISWDQSHVRAWEAAAALEAAQRPPVSGEYTHVVNLARASEAADKGLDALIDYLADLPTVEEWRPPVSPEVDRLRARVRELEAQRADVLAEVQALEHSDWLRDTIAGDRLRAALTDSTPSDTERSTT